VIVVDHRAQEPASWRPGNTTRLAVGAQTGATGLCLVEQWFDPGTGAPTHTHFDTEEAITVLEGRAEFWADGERAELGPEMTIVLPAHSHHGFTNVGEGTLHIWASFSDASVRTQYDAEPDASFAIGGTGGRRVDPARVRLS
jgi:quercetin dioxygenase-like cupin family protein